MRLWARATLARRALSRLKKQLIGVKLKAEIEKQFLIKHYEAQLAIERTRNETLHLAWADRWLQREKLATLSVSTSLIAEKAELKLKPEDREELDESLSANQSLELQTRKEKFFQDGIALDKPAQEIQNRWQDIYQDVVQDVRMAIQ